MKLLFVTIDLILIYWAVMFTAGIKWNVKNVLSFVLFVFCPTSLIFLWDGQWQGIVFFILSSLVYFYLIGKEFIILIHFCFFIIIGILLDNLTQYIMEPFPFDFLPGILEQYCVFIILYNLSIMIYRYFYKKVVTLVPEMKSVYIFILFVLIVTMVTFYINIYLMNYFSINKLLVFNIVIQITYFAIMLFILSLTIFNIKKQHYINQIEFENAQFAEYMKSLEVINNDMQKFRHDYMNILITMQGYIETDDFEGLKTYFKKHIFSAEADTLKRNQLLATLTKLKITGIKGLILTKILQAEKENIEVQIEIPDEIDEIHMNMIDLARILGIFLDNAIEANSNVNTDEEKCIDIAFYKTNNNSVMIIIENTFFDRLEDVEEIFEEGFSTKGENRGKGLSNVRSIIKNYPNVYLNTSINGNLFTHVLEIQNNE
ncbi:GHKL domain-containing protein [Ureibacillus sp. FSL K6-8385]|uniref:GHKL domain-containing protein n=2 Tax=Ureibacillus terrenus TaxID=118246 RepID=A0A540V1U8_9BACL|nr:GHKL domain-containing protein [Ureibacillus terrenus]MED3662784.1 GHKL domain-containing protein [Ureibacillus terrenus]TQE90697.1 GHKL domain-containing protein [Ureibacillus terrenus]